MKTFNIFLLAVAPFAVHTVLNAQAIAPNKGSQSSSTTSGNYSSSTIEKQSDKIFDVNSDVFNPGEGMLLYKGKIFNIEDSKIIRERFERYLSAPEPEGDEREYAAIIADINSLLSQENIPSNQVNAQMIKAMSRLVKLSEFEIDGGQALILARQVYKTCRQRAEIRDLAAWQRALEAEQQQLQQKINNREMIRRKEAAQKKEGSGKDKKPTSTDVAPTPEQVFLTQTAAETKAAKAAIGTQSEASTLQAKLDFQSVIATFLITRHYEHANLATAFYRTLFKGSHHELKVGKKEIADMLPISNFVPSLESIDQISQQLQQETSRGVKSADALWQQGQKYHAFRQLIAAFFIGENELSVAYYPPEKKREFLKLWLSMQELQRESENKDIAAIEESLKKIIDFAPDFPRAEIEGKIRAAKQASKMAILRAKTVALTAAGEGTPEAREKASVEIERCIMKAAELWPQNPEIEKFMEEMHSQVNVMAQLKPEFDKLVRENKKREIYNRRSEFTAALMQDAVRRKSFEEIVSQIAAVEAGLAQVNMLIARRDEYIAWDLIQKIDLLCPNDPDVAMIKAKISPLVAEYARLLTLATREEARGNNAAAIAHYIAAQNFNSVSEICSDGMKRCAEEILISQKTSESAPTGSAEEKTTVPAENPAEKEEPLDDALKL